MDFRAKMLVAHEKHFDVLHQMVLIFSQSPMDVNFFESRSFMTLSCDMKKTIEIELLSGCQHCANGVRGIIKVSLLLARPRDKGKTVIFFHTL